MFAGKPLSHWHRPTSEPFDRPLKHIPMLARLLSVPMEYGTASLWHTIYMCSKSPLIRHWWDPEILPNQPIVELLNELQKRVIFPSMMYLYLRREFAITVCHFGRIWASTIALMAVRCSVAHAPCGTCAQKSSSMGDASVPSVIVRLRVVADGHNPHVPTNGRCRRYLCGICFCFSAVQ